MFKVELDKVIIGFVEVFRNEISMPMVIGKDVITTKALCVDLFLKATGDGYAVDTKHVYMLFFSETNVMFAETNELAETDVPPEHFRCTSTHNSCWRSDGFVPLRILYQEMYENMQQNFDNVDMSVQFGFANSRYPFLVEVDYKRNDGRPKVVEVRRI